MICTSGYKAGNLYPRNPPKQTLSVKESLVEHDCPRQSQPHRPTVTTTSSYSPRMLRSFLSWNCVGIWAYWGIPVFRTNNFLPSWWPLLCLSLTPGAGLMCIIHHSSILEPSRTCTQYNRTSIFATTPNHLAGLSTRMYEDGAYYVPLRECR